VPKAEVVAADLDHTILSLLWHRLACLWGQYSLEGKGWQGLRRGW